jgi:hypothetical protein
MSQNSFQRAWKKGMCLRISLTMSSRFIVQSLAVARFLPRPLVVSGLSTASSHSSTAVVLPSRSVPVGPDLCLPFDLDFFRFVIVISSSIEALPMLNSSQS